MKFYQKLSVFIFIMMLCSGCWELRVKEGNGDIIEKSYDVDAFDALEVSGFYKVKLVEGDRENVLLEADENLMEDINVYSTGSKLIIDSEEHLKSDHGIYVTVTYKSIEKITSSGASEVENEGTIVADNLEVEMSGAGKIDLSVETQTLELDISGAGLIRLAGETNRQYLELSGAGKLDAYDLRSKECFVNLSGVGAAEIYVTERLEASVSGIGNIKYRGNPSKVSQDVSGLGKVKKDRNDSDDEI